MEDQVITSTTEPTIVESANTSAENTAGLSQVIDQATPMDSNTTYSNLPKVEYQPNMTPTQNLINEAVQTEHAINQETNAGKAMNNFLTQGYDYDKAEAGSYWVAGAINDNNTQMSFLQTLINEEMYDEMDLQKYYYDTNLATARAYAAQKGKETAYGFYRAAQERALAEGELTGWYMPAEGRYLLGQYTVAQNTLENPNATPEEISKANRVAKAAESWFSANQITTRGIKCLAMMNYEENVRHNTVMGELQKQANAIAAQGAAASAASANIALREYKFQIEELELARGQNFSKIIGLDNSDLIGHEVDYKYQALQGYDSVKDALNDDSVYTSVLNARGKGFLEATLKKAGVIPEERFKEYNNRQKYSAFRAETTETGKISDTSAGFTSTKKKNANGNEIKYTVVGNKVIAGYFNDGVWNPITDENAKFSDGKSIKTYIENTFGKGSMDTTGINSITIEGETYRFGNASTAGNATSYTSLSDMGYEKGYSSYASPNNVSDKVDTIIKQSESEEGYKQDGKVYKNLQYEPRKMDEKNFNEYNIFSAEVEGKKVYVSINAKSGKKVDIHEVDTVDVPSVKDTLVEGKGITSGLDLFSGDKPKERVFKSSWVVGYDKANDRTYMALPNTDGTIEYYSIEGKVKTSDTDDAIGKKVISIDSDTVRQQAKDAGYDVIGDEIISVDGTYDNDKDNTNKDLDIKIQTPIVGDVDTNKNYSQYNPEEREAVFKKYSVTPFERREYMDILDPKELDKKLSERYLGILGQGGVHNGK